MTLLSDLIGSRLTYSRSVNVERGVASSGTVPAYILTQRSLEALDRIATAFETDGVPRAWTVTGPYGSGKSAFALFLSGLFSGNRTEVHAATDAVLRAKNDELADRIQMARDQLAGEDGTGFIIAMATAEREPAAKTIARALLSGITSSGRRPGRPPKVVKELRDLAAASEPDPRRVLVAFDEVTRRAPVVLLLDEFGKNLEYAADDPAIGDLYILQQLAERLAGDEALPGALITLQHLSFADYAFGLPAERLREWNKVQGRFEDISFLEADDQTAQLIAEALDQSEGKGVAKSIKAWAKEQVASARAVGIDGGVSSDVAIAERCYPLHPVAVDTLAHLTSRYGQHERSLFTLLTSSEPFSLGWYMDRTSWDPQDPPSYGLMLLFDYFVTNVADVPSSAAHAARWLEIRSRVIEARSVSDSARGTLKVIGLLNLLGDAGGLRASPEVMQFLRPDAQQDIDELLQSGVLTYRGFADEYRIWEGSDYDLSAAVAAQRDRTRDESISDQVESVLSLAPRVAQRHSHESGTLRYFEQRFVEDLPPELHPSNPNADGVIYFVFGSGSSEVALPATTSCGKPVLFVSTPDALRIDEAAREAAAIAELLSEDTELQGDRVAQREARVRASIAQRTLARRLQQAFEAGRPDVKWWASQVTHDVRSDRDVSRLISDLCDSFYGQAPVIRNEMINRSTLTSQGARARRVFLQAMIDHPEELQFGLEGSGPDVAIYRAVVEEGKIVDPKRRLLRLPPKRSSLRASTQHVYDRIRESEGPIDLGTIVEELTLPPYGARRGVIPMLLATVLLAREDEIAIYQDGSFEPILAADVFERLIKAPERFTARHVGVDGSYSEVIRALRDKLQIASGSRSGKWRNATLLSIIRPVLGGLRQLPDFSMRTRLVSKRAQEARRVLTEVREPDRLVFAALPEALGVNLRDPSAAEDYASLLAATLAELRDAYEDHVRRWVVEEMADALWPPQSKTPDADERLDLAKFRTYMWAHRQDLDGQILDRRLDSFLRFVANRQLPDDEWIDAVALNVSGRPAQSWRDEDRGIFVMRLAELAGTFNRVQALYSARKAAGRIEGFTAVRVTLTSGSAQERDRVVWVDDQRRPVFEALAADFLERATILVGPDGPEALLTVLAERILSTEEPDVAPRVDVPSLETESGVS